MRIAIVEDDLNYQQQLQEYLCTYGQEHNLTFEVTIFSDGSEILPLKPNSFDIILLDVEMPKLDGMTTAEQIRKQDGEVVLMFITQMAQYAINGYAVGALDFVLKPLNYYTFSLRFARAVKRVEKQGRRELLLTLPERVVRVRTDQIYYIEVQNRMLHYYTDSEEYVCKGTMQKVEQELAGDHFVRCNHWYLVNLRHVSEVRREVVVVAGQELEISRRNRTAFLNALTDYVGGNQ